MNIRSRLLLLVLAVWLPAVAAFVLLADRARSADEASARASLSQAADAFIATVEREFDKKAVMASTLAASSGLGGGDMAAFLREARAAVRRDPGSWVTVISPTHVLLNTIEGGTVPARRPPQAPWADDGPRVFFMPSATVVSQPVLGMFMPVDASTAQRLNVVVSFKPKALQDLLADVRVPKGAVVALLNQDMLVMARSRDIASWLGRAATGQVYAMGRARRGGFVRSTTLDGVASLSYVTAPNRYGWITVIALPSSALDSAAAILTARVIGASVALLMIGLALALFGARPISEAVLALRDAAATVGRNEVPPALKTGLPEADAVSATLEQAARQTQEASRQLEARVADAVARAEAAHADLFESRKREAMGRLTGGIAHDFNNLLQTMSMGLQVLDRGLDADAPQRRALGAAMRACGKAADLIRQMLTFGRAQALRPQPVPLDDFILKALELTTKAVGPGIELQATVEPGTRAAFADAAQLELALLNLVFNARDAMPAGGRILIHARDASASELPRQVQGDFICLEVRDNGSGMDAETLRRAVEPFFTTKPVGSGTGLGLAQVHSFARESGGDVRLQSERGRGTAVSIYLPAAAVAQADLPEAEPANAPVRRRLRVLMVEDDVLVSAVVVPALEAAGHDIRLCHCADDALEVLGEQSFDVLFTDVVMPGATDGHQLARWCRVHRPELPVVLATGYSARAGAATEGKLLSKPYTIEELLQALDDAASRQARPVSNSS